MAKAYHIKWDSTKMDYVKRKITETIPFDEKYKIFNLGNQYAVGTLKTDYEDTKKFQKKTEAMKYKNKMNKALRKKVK